MKVFVTGGTGLVGSNVIKVAKERFEAEVVASIYKRVPEAPADYTIERMNVADRTAVMAALVKHRPDLVIHCAATVDHDRLEYDHAMGWRLMVEATRIMAEACGEVGAKLIFVSTDWVFDGKNPPYKENTHPCPVNYYGLLKVIGETIVNSTGIDYGIARIAAVYGRNWSFPGWTPKEKVTGFGTLANWMLETLLRGEEVVEWTKHVNIQANPTLASDCADAMMTIFTKKEQGIFHCCGRDCCTRVELGGHVARTFDLDVSKVRAATPGEMDLSSMEGSSPLPLRTYLEVSETEHRLDRENIGIMEGLEEWKHQINTNQL